MAFLSATDLMAGTHFVRDLPAFLRHTATLAEAERRLRLRFENRELDFLELVRRGIFQHDKSPYLALLKHVGCEYGDLEQLVKQSGVEGALTRLIREGVYLTADEFKGRKQLVRGTLALEMSPEAARNPLVSRHLVWGTSGSTGSEITVYKNLSEVQETALDLGLVLSAREGLEWAHAYWGVPGGAAINKVLVYHAAGCPLERWFTRVNANAPTLHPRYRWSIRALRWGSLLARVNLPEPVHVPASDPSPIARWMGQRLRAGQTPHLSTQASSAVRVCEAAEELGISLIGANFSIGGEPATSARVEAIRRTGAKAYPGYASTEADLIGRGCLNPKVSDDLHLFNDLHAFVQMGEYGSESELPEGAILVSSLRATDSLILLNLCLGDEAVMTRRACGCPLEALGWMTHIHTIRSYEKLTVAGMNLADTDVVEVLERLLPARFGGSPTDYQLIEEEDNAGRPVLRLLVHPKLGPLDMDEVRNAFLEGIGSGNGIRQITALLWSDSGLIRVTRCEPMVTVTGKIQHVVSRKSRSGDAAQ